MTNQAAWLTAKGEPLKIDDAEMWKPGDDEVLIKNAAAAVNPVDWKMQDSGFHVQNYPVILGTDVAGEVVETGKNVSHVKKGQRVIGHCLGLVTNHNKSGGFQKYTVCSGRVVVPIPDSMSYESASVLPLGLSTAGMGLFDKELLALPPPTKNQKPTGTTLLVWGGAASMGACAIQLAVASGCEVTATASKRNHEFVKSLGAKAVFDYSSPHVIDAIVDSLKGTKFGGIFDAISEGGTIETCAEIGTKLGGCKIALVLPDSKGSLTGKVSGTNVFAAMFPTANAAESDALWLKWAPGALADGSLQAKPDPIVFEGLEKTQEAFDRQKKGVSAAKVVVKL